MVEVQDVKRYFVEGAIFHQIGESDHFRNEVGYG